MSLMGLWSPFCSDSDEIEASERVTIIRDQQGDSIAAGREFACSQHTELRIQGRDGRFRET